MNRISSNAGAGDFVINSFNELGETTSKLYLAAPYFTASEPILEAVDEAKKVKLLIGLNVATSPSALEKVHGKPGVAIRYLTHRFHAKIYLFDDAALLGSSNLTEAGLKSNREAVIRLDRAEDAEAVEEVRALFVELWDAARVLTSAKLEAFEASHAKVIGQRLQAEEAIEQAVGRVEPRNVRVGSGKKTKERMFLDRLQREVYEQYGQSFDEVRRTLDENGLRRPDLGELGATNETNRFLNFVRETHASETRRGETHRNWAGRIGRRKLSGWAGNGLARKTTGCRKDSLPGLRTWNARSGRLKRLMPLPRK